MWLSNLIGMTLGIIFGLVGLTFIGVFSVNPCSSMAVVFDNARESLLHQSWLGFECDRWPSIIEGMLTEWVPSVSFLAFSGALAVRIGEPILPWQGAITGGLVAIIAFALRASGVSISSNSITNLVIFGAATALIGVLAGWIGGKLARRAFQTARRSDEP